MSLKINKIKTVIISVTNDLSFDQRVSKVCDSLMQLDLEVVLVGRKLKNSKSLDRKYKTKRFKLLFNKGFLFYAEFNLRLFLWLLCQKKSIYHANDLDTLLPMWLISKIKRSNIVYDSHEYFLGVPEIQKRLFVKKVWGSIERFIFPRLKYVFTVNKSIANLYYKDYNIMPKVLRNLPTSNSVDKIKTAKELGFPTKKKIVILQGAGINIHRGSEELIEAISSQDEFFLCIVGKGDVLQYLKDRAKRSDLKNKVLFVDALPYVEMMQYTINADVGVSFDKASNINHELSLPNKIFDYAKAGIPFVATNLLEVTKIIKNYSTGVTVKSLKKEDIITGLKKAIHLKVNSDFRNNINKMNRELNWEKESKELMKLYQSFLVGLF